MRKKATKKPRKPAETPGFQDIVRRFDNKWWYTERSEGPATLIHQYLHLIPSICKTIPRDVGRDDQCPETSRCMALWKNDVAPRLLEHAARIVNQLDGHVVILVRRSKLDVTGKIKWGDKQERTFAIYPPADIPESHNCVEDINMLLRQLVLFGGVCERLDSMEEFSPDGQFSKYLVNTAATLMQFAYHFAGPHLVPKSKDAQAKTLRAFLRPLRVRLRHLHQWNLTHQPPRPVIRHQ